MKSPDSGVADRSSPARQQGHRPCIEIKLGDVISLFKRAEGEVFPGAHGVIDVHPAMHGDLALAVHETIEEVIDEVVGRL